jgi:kynureninase
MDEWTRWRAEFPILEHVAYLNSCSLGALSHRAEAQVAAFHQEWHRRGASAWYDVWIERLDRLRAQVARLLGADTAEIALAPSTSVALATLASAVDQRRRPRVVVSELDFPTLGYAWMSRPDVELVRVPSDDGATIALERWADAVDERTAIVATSHVFFTTGAIQDVTAIAGIAHARGALCIIDAYQGIGQVPLDVHAAGVDALTAGPLKWLLGGPGLAYLYVRQELARTLRPTVTGWFGARDQFDFDITRYQPRDDARRFELGTPALAVVHAALGGQSIIEEIGIPQIRQRNHALTERLVELAGEAGLELLIAPTPDQRSAIVMIGDDDPKAAVRVLADRRIIVDARPGWVRVSPHFYNTDDEVDAVIATLVARRTGRLAVPDTAQRGPAAVLEPGDAVQTTSPADDVATGLRLAQRAVDDWISAFPAGYWPPLSNLARLVEEVGELARELNHRYGHKPKKPEEAEQDIGLELADVLFVLVALANQQGIDLGDAFQRTLDKYRVRDAARWGTPPPHHQPG